jgi:hypothetical protein
LIWKPGKKLKIPSTYYDLGLIDESPG